MKIIYADLDRLINETEFSRPVIPAEELPPGNAIDDYKRKRIREHLLRLMTPEIYMLELNSGTGEDAIYLARLGHRVHTTNGSDSMQQGLRAKVIMDDLQASVSNELCSMTQLFELKNRGPFDHIFSNAGGLNSISELEEVFELLPGLLKPNGLLTLVVKPGFCLWEALQIFKGKWKMATKRWLKRSGDHVLIEDAYFDCRYYNPSDIIKHTHRNFDLLEIEGLCTIVPPSFNRSFPAKYPLIYRFLESMEDRFKSSFLCKSCGYYYIISLRKK